MRAVLIDDEYYALQGLKMKLDEVSGIEVVGMFTNGRQALEQLEQLRPDIVFLDIEMPTISGLELYPKIKELCCDAKIAFTTAYQQYAVGAFELNALDYLIKPIEKERIVKTMERMGTTVSASQANARGIEVDCFGKLSIKVNGLEIKQNIRKKTEELVAFLICFGGRFVAKEKIVDALWPETDPEKAANNLYVAFNNLKRPEFGLLSNSIESARGKMRICNENIVCDLLEFRELIKDCKTVDDGKVAKAERAVELYRGMPFEENYYPWATFEQTETEVAFIGLLDKIINYYTGIGESSKARFYGEKRTALYEEP